MRRHQIRNEILLFSDALCYFVETLLKSLVCLYMRLSHFIENDRRTMLRSDFELSADVIFYKLAHEFVVFILHKIIVAYAGADENSFYSLDLSYFAEHSQILSVVGFKRRAGCRCETFFSHAKSFA